VDDMSLEGILQFPCEFPLKVIGWNNEDLTADVVQILKKHVPGFEPASITSRLSNGEKYRSLSMNFTAQSRDQVDALYIELTAHQQILWVL